MLLLMLSKVEDFSYVVNFAQHKLDSKKFPLIEENSLTPILDKDKKFIFTMVMDELEELKQAKDEVEVVDAVVDMLYYILDFSAKKSFKLAIVPKIRMFDTTKPLKFFIEDITNIVKGNMHLLLFSGTTRDDIQELLVDTCYSLLEISKMDIPVEEVFNIVHKANMRKFVNGEVKLDTDVNSPRYGKVLKPEGWVSPDSEIKELLSRKGLERNLSDSEIDEWHKAQLASNK